MRRASLALIATLAGCSSPPGVTGSSDAGELDAAGMPAPPVLGAQLDRIGRPVIVSALIGVFAADASTAAQREVYARASDPAAWRTTMVRPNVTIEDEMAANLAVFDAIDRGMAVSSGTLAGCGNALKYAGPPDAYAGAADIFADDQLYIDTSRTACTAYLALEIEYASAGTFVHDTCGGRTLNHDVVDVTYSVLAAGTQGLDPTSDFSGKLSDGVSVHGDISGAFPFLGPPH